MRLWDGGHAALWALMTAPLPTLAQTLPPFSPFLHSSSDLWRQFHFHLVSVAVNCYLGFFFCLQSFKVWTWDCKTPTAPMIPLTATTTYEDGDIYIYFIIHLPCICAGSRVGANPSWHAARWKQGILWTGQCLAGPHTVQRCTMYMHLLYSHIPWAVYNCRSTCCACCGRKPGTWSWTQDMGVYGCHALNCSIFTHFSAPWWCLD